EHRRSAMWKVEETIYEDLLNAPSNLDGLKPSRFGRGKTKETKETKETTAASPLVRMSMPERVKADYTTMNLTTGPHPMKLLRSQLPEIWRASDLRSARHGSTIQIAGNVICRQRPGT